MLDFFEGVGSFSALSLIVLETLASLFGFTVGVHPGNYKVRRIYLPVASLPVITSPKIVSPGTRPIN
jgi:hypothetical protein